MSPKLAISLQMWVKWPIFSILNYSLLPILKISNLLTKKNSPTIFQTGATLTLAALITAGARAQTPRSPKTYTCYRTEKHITIDGRMNEQS